MNTQKVKPAGMQRRYGTTLRTGGPLYSGGYFSPKLRSASTSLVRTSGQL